MSHQKINLSTDRRNHTATAAIMLFFALALFAISALTQRMQYPLEVRYLSVAFDMMQSHNYILPVFNHTPYLHKTPLFFWLIIAGWKLFGFSLWWPRFVQAILTTATGMVFANLLRQLYPQKDTLYQSLLLFSNIFWLLFIVTINFDLMLTLFILLSMYGLLLLSNNNKKGIIITCIAIPLAIFSKGPVGYVFILPAIILHRYWRSSHSFNKKMWHYTTLIALLLSVILLLAWTISLHVFASVPWSSFTHQVTERLLNSHAHNFNAHIKPFYFYLLISPLTLLPWLLLPGFWRASTSFKKFTQDPGNRLCLTIILPAMVILSCVSGKNYNYILPLIPFITLLASNHLQQQLSPKTILTFALITLALILAALFITGISAQLPLIAAGLISMLMLITWLYLNKKSEKFARDGCLAALAILVVSIALFAYPIIATKSKRFLAFNQWDPQHHMYHGNNILKYVKIHSS